mmetsp:Transcript_35806/g.83281  ORF Transcript_35806/g.83281 Transcript_35806/m.83281 type:complete len:256 (-) Transcript_35806:1001-1768(-)
MPPCGPQQRLADALLWLWRRPQSFAVHRSVVQSAALHKERLFRFVASTEDVLALSVRLLLQGKTAQLVHHNFHLLVEAFEELVFQQVRRVHLVRQLVLQRLGERVEDLELRRLDNVVLLQRLVLQVLVDAAGQILGHVALPEVTAEEPELLHLVALHAPQGRHRARDTADDGREDDHGKEEDDNGEYALQKVLGADIHGSGRELRQAPVEAGAVDVRGGPPQGPARLDPARFLPVNSPLPYHIPQACNHMVQCQH